MACRYLKDGGRADILERLGSIVEVGHDGLKMKRRAEFQCELEIRRLNDPKEEPLRRNGCLISVVEPEDDAAPFLFFEAGTTVFLPREDDIIPFALYPALSLIQMLLRSLTHSHLNLL
ncbi:hypothetical protein GOBAR_AA09502 [Gossypium barbadense]|uniref:Uncharacterized protein n=1 Tax=Gossypium barbadense TaxID=3634 RepID=A0A2P5Y6D7_GOSBA|nr:hypothetical protein GOBAR_AA09502 [Gossypium barbadense]